MASTFPTVLESWPATRAVWVAGWDGLRHYVPAGGGGAGVCLRVVLPAPPVLAFPDLDETCCPACLRLAVAAERLTATRETLAGDFRRDLLPPWHVQGEAP